MKQRLWTAGFCVLGFFGVFWFYLAHTMPPFMDEPELMAYAKAVSMTGQLKSWQFDLAILTDVPFNFIRGKYIPFACAWAFKTSGDPVFLCRLLPLFFTLLTYGIVLFYFRFRKLLTPLRFCVWTVLFLCSSIVVDNAYYLRFYASLATFMTLVFILYWEGLGAFQARQKLKSFALWFCAGVLFCITVLDQWQYQQIPIMGLAMGVSTLALTRYYLPFVRWFNQYALWICMGIFLLAPVATMAMDKIPVPLNTVNICHWFLTYWDNLVGFLRVIVAVNIGILALRFSFTSEKPLTFDRWMFICGVAGMILSALYNPSNQVFFSRYSYLPVVMILVGLSGIFDEVFVSDQIRRRLLIVYMVINIMVFAGNAYCEHSNIRSAIAWLNKNITGPDVLLGFDPLLDLNGGKGLMPKLHLISASENLADVKALREYLLKSPQGRVFYLYNDGYAFRDWLYQKTMGIDRYPASDLFKFLAKQVPAQDILPGLRQCGLLEFDRDVLLNRLAKLSVKGFEDPFKAPEKIIIKEALKNIGLVK